MGESTNVTIIQVHWQAGVFVRYPPDNLLFLSLHVAMIFGLNFDLPSTLRVFKAMIQTGDIHKGVVGDFGTFQQIGQGLVTFKDLSENPKRILLSDGFC